MATNQELEERLRRHVYVLAELIGERNIFHPTAIEAAREYLRRELRAMGATVAEQVYPTSQRTAANLEVIAHGRQRDAPILVVGAHYDSSFNTPGADDNASAVAILLEMARSLLPLRLKRDVHFVFYDCEEMPHFATHEMGSQQHAERLRANGAKLLGMICLESLGYFPSHQTLDPSLPRWIRLLMRIAGSRSVAVVSDPGSMRFGLRFVWAFLRSGHFPFVPAALPRRWLPEIELSDHRSYWDAGYPALMVTDTAFMRNPNYHQPTDRLHTLDLERMTALCETLIGSVARLACRADPRKRCPL